MVISRQMHVADAAAHDLDRARRARHHAGAQAGQVESREIRMVEFGDEHRRHAVERGAAFLGHGLQGRQRIEALAGEHDRGAMRHAGQHADHHAEAMIHRHRDADRVLLGVAHALRR